MADISDHLLLDFGGVLFPDLWEGAIRSLSDSFPSWLPLSSLISIGEEVWRRFDTERVGNEKQFWEEFRSRVCAHYEERYHEQLSCVLSLDSLMQARKGTTFFNTSLADVLNRLPNFSVSIASNNTAFFLNSQLSLGALRGGLTSHSFASCDIGLRKSDPSYWSFVRSRCKGQKLLFIDDRSIALPINHGITCLKVHPYPKYENAIEIECFIRQNSDLLK